MPRGFDAGTYNLVCAWRDEANEIKSKKEVNAFIEIPLENPYLFKVMQAAKVPLFKRENFAYVIGQAAINMAYTLSKVDLKRPMKDGCLNPKEKDAFNVLRTMIHSLIGKVEKDNEVIYYSVPANAVNEETDADWHQKVLSDIFQKYNVDGKKLKAYPINEALAIIYSELEESQYTGIGISCLAPGTKIYTNDGIVKIENVKEGDLVITHKGRWKPINKVIKKPFNGVMKKLQIQGYVNNTNFYKFVDNHELYVKRNGEWNWVGCNDLLVGDIVGEPILNQRRDHKTNYIRWSDRITCSKQSTKHQVEVNSDICRLIGYFLGDGSVNHAEGCVQFDFGLNEEVNITDVKTILHKNFGKYTSNTKKSDNCVRLKCYSKGLARWFGKKCYKNKKKNLPFDISTFNYGQCLNLLVGLIRSDGNFTADGVRFGNSNSKLALLAKQCFSRLSIPATVSYRKSGKKSVIEERVIVSKKPEWAITASGKLTESSLKEMVKNIDCKSSKFAEKVFIEDGFCCGRIQKIETENYIGEVYDLQVEDDHSFSGPFLTIHNCGAGMVNFCYAIYGTEICSFSIVNSGDWIDNQAAKATGETPTFINKEKTKIDLTASPKNLVERAIQGQYKLMIEKTVTQMKKAIVEKNTIRHPEGAITMVLAGGTTAPNGFVELFKKEIEKAEMPVTIGEIRRPNDFLGTVAKGCLIAAEMSQ